jgi:hypothetical protein
VTEDDFDPDRYILDGPVISSTPPRLAKRKDQFVMLPLSALDLLTTASQDKLLPVYCHLLYESWRTGGQPVKLANGFLARLGISRDAKASALHRLERLSLVTVEWRDNKSPIVTVRVP